MSFYRAILAIQGEPLDAGPDDVGRATLTLNFDASLIRSTNVNIPRELAKIITDAGLATLPNPPSVEGDLFLSSTSTIPTGGGPYTQILLGGGPPSIRSHGKKANITTQDTVRFQIATRAINGEVAYDKIVAIRDELDNVFNKTLTE